ncbi:MAG TPA: hypothetical protein VGD27_02060 [Longimicrobiales bacterium]
MRPTLATMTDMPIPEVPIKRPPPEDRLLLRLQPLLTLVIAFAAIGLAIWEGAENRRHNRLSVQPRLGAEINTGRDTAGEFVSMSIENTGLGPAVVTSFHIYFDGVRQDTVTAGGRMPWQSAIDAFAAAGAHINAHAFGTDYYFPAGRQQILFQAVRPKGETRANAALADILTRLALQICYCSIYNSDCEEVVLTTARWRAPSCLP